MKIVPKRQKNELYWKDQEGNVILEKDFTEHAQIQKYPH